MLGGDTLQSVCMYVCTVLEHSGCMLTRYFGFYVLPEFVHVPRLITVYLVALFKFGG